MSRRQPDVTFIVERATTSRSAEDVFAFFDRPANVKRVMPGSLAVTLESHPADLRPGTIFAYRLKRWPLDLAWDTVVSEYRPPEGFTHVKARGYFPKWVYRYSIVPEKADERRTSLSISLAYEVPPGLYDTLSNSYVIRSAMKELVREQMRAICAALESGP